ncbi:hypothetical protein SYNGFB01_07935 [Synechococcus sp. GFB01]|nr:DUF192 domain-containing protein [Synechococcus sp. GFB01]KMM16892.1 hypothetical protein SYNGFB01_07935 [Synechococcus sp. GFB01]
MLVGAGSPAWANRPTWQQPPPQVLPIEARWCLQPGRCIDLEVADEPHEQAKGLQLRPPLPALRGMWFPFDRPTPARFWMHRTPEPLDMLFVRDGRVVAIETAAQPCMHLPCRSYGPDEPVDGVIELASGQAAAQGIAVGTPASIEPLLAVRSGAQPAPARD